MRTAAPLAFATLLGALFPSGASAATPFAATSSSDLIPALVIAGAGALVIMLIMIVVPGARRSGPDAASEGDEAPTVTAFRAHPMDAASGVDSGAEPSSPEAEAPEPQPAFTPAEPVAAQIDPAFTPAEPVAAQTEPASTPAEPVTAQTEPAFTPAEPVTAQTEPAFTPAEPAPAHPDSEPEEELEPVFAGRQPAFAAAEMTGATAEMTLLFAEAIAPERVSPPESDPTEEEASVEDAEMLDEDDQPTTGGQEIFRTVAPSPPADEDTDGAVFAGAYGAVAVADPPRAATAAPPRQATPTPAPAPDLLSALSPAALLDDSFEPEQLRAAMAQGPVAPPPLGLGREPDARTVLRDHSLAVPVAACMLLGVTVHLVRAARRR